jgi:hypothetical protein
LYVWDVQVALNVGGVDLGCQAEGVHQELAQRRRGRSLLVEDVVDVVGDALEHVQDVPDGVLKLVEVGRNLSNPVLLVLGGRDELQPRLLGLAVFDFVGNGDEQARVGGTLGCDTNGGGDVCPRLDLLAGLGRNSQVDGRVWPCAVALLAVEVLDEGGEGVQVTAGGVPADEDLTGVRAQVQGEHLLLVVHVDLDLLGRLGVGDGIAVADLDLSAVFAAGAEESSDDALLVGGAAEGVVEDGENGLGSQYSALTLYTEAARTCGWMTTFSGAVEGCAPTGAGPSGRARWRKESVSDMMAGVALGVRWCVRPESVRAWWWWGRNCIVPARCGSR